MAQVPPKFLIQEAVIFAGLGLYIRRSRKYYNELARAKSGAIVGAGTLRAIVLVGDAIGWLGRLLRDFVYSGRAIVVETIVN